MNEATPSGGRIGVTGPHLGLSPEQERFVAQAFYEEILRSDPPVTELVSGCAYGVDTIGIEVALRAKAPLIRLTTPQVQVSGYPVRYLNSNLGNVVALLRKERGSEGWVLEKAKPGRNVSEGYLLRNDLTVARSDVLLAAPPTSSELKGQGPGAGTWATIRRARKAGIEIRAFPLDGSSPWVESATERLFR